MKLALFVPQECFNEMQCVIDSGLSIEEIVESLGDILYECYQKPESTVRGQPNCYYSRDNEIVFTIGREIVSIMSPRLEVLKR